MENRRQYELIQKRDRAGLTPAEKRELTNIESGKKTGRPVGSGPGQNVDRIKKRAAGRAIAKQLIATMGDGYLTGACPETRAAFCEEIREYLDTVLPPRDLQPAVAMTARECLSLELEPMPFGKYTGQQIASVPLKYLDWLAGESTGFATRISRYLKNEQIAVRLAAELGE